jgi:hypothetical protein
MTLPSLVSARASETPAAAGEADSDAAADGSVDAGADDGAVVGAATDGAVVAAPPPLEQAAAIAAIATTEGSRRVRRTFMVM